MKTMMLQDGGQIEIPDNTKPAMLHDGTFIFFPANAVDQQIDAAVQAYMGNPAQQQTGDMMANALQSAGQMAQQLGQAISQLVENTSYSKDIAEAINNLSQVMMQNCQAQAGIADQPKMQYSQDNSANGD